MRCLLFGFMLLLAACTSMDEKVVPYTTAQQDSSEFEALINSLANFEEALTTFQTHVREQDIRYRVLQAHLTPILGHSYKTIEDLRWRCNMASKSYEAFSNGNKEIFRQLATLRAKMTALEAVGISVEAFPETRMLRSREGVEAVVREIPRLGEIPMVRFRELCRLGSERIFVEGERGQGPPGISRTLAFFSSL